MSSSFNFIKLKFLQFQISSISNFFNFKFFQIKTSTSNFNIKLQLQEQERLVTTVSDLFGNVSTSENSTRSTRFDTTRSDLKTVVSTVDNDIEVKEIVKVNHRTVLATPPKSEHMKVVNTVVNTIDVNNALQTHRQTRKLKDPYREMVSKSTPNENMANLSELMKK